MILSSCCRSLPSTLTKNTFELMLYIIITVNKVAIVHYFHECLWILLPAHFNFRKALDISDMSLLSISNFTIDFTVNCEELFRFLSRYFSDTLMYLLRYQIPLGLLWASDSKLLSLRKK